MSENIKIFLQDPHQIDFEKYKAYVLKKNEISLINFKEADLKFLFKKIYYLGFLQEKLEINSDFLKEAIFNLLLSMDLLNFHFWNPLKLQLRSSIEQFYRYLLKRIEIDTTEMSARNINSTVKSNYQNLKLSSLIAKLQADYKDLCNYVHVSIKEFFSKNHSLNYLSTIEDKKLRNIINQISRICDCFVIILISLNYDSYCKIGLYNQNFIENSLSKEKLENYL
ncbi:hypothetical protein IUK39_03390 [Priestia aryabhattai]|uniref:hypothetical protein n=1 Tax=Priestia aryabhattai TaxID=412384 RepID=UPI001C0CFD26|nr:hypothetical protein [Priestia aryabhattai]MBU3569221.1 hypothetical protein [Priestia aryabhattai]